MTPAGVRACDMLTSMDPIPERLRISEEQLAAFCRTWSIARLELFGSALRDDFDATSDIDVLVTFLPDARISLFTLDRLERDLANLVGRDVDVVERRVIEDSPNWIRRNSILRSAQLLYAAA